MAESRRLARNDRGVAHRGQDPFLWDLDQRPRAGERRPGGRGRACRHLQVIYNVFDQSPEDELFPTVESAGVGVIVRVPFDEGGLTGKVTPETRFPDGDWRKA